MALEGVEGWNTRIWRNEDDMERDGLPLFQLRVASSLILPTKVHTYKVCHIYIYVLYSICVHILIMFPGKVLNDA